MRCFSWFAMFFLLILSWFLAASEPAQAARVVRSRTVVVNRGVRQRAVVVNNFGHAATIDQFGRVVTPFSFHGSSAFGFVPVQPFGFGVQSFGGFQSFGGCR